MTPPTTQFEVPPSEKIAGGFQQAGKKEGGLGEEIFTRLLRAEGAVKWEQLRTAVRRAEPRGGSIPFKIGSHCVQ